jgi:hypothetical protein
MGQGNELSWLVDLEVIRLARLSELFEPNA